MEYTTHAAKTKTLISCAVIALLICAFVFAYADYWFSDAVAHLCLIARDYDYVYDHTFENALPTSKV